MKLVKRPLSIKSTTILYILLLLPFYKPGCIAEMQIGVVEWVYAFAEVLVTIWVVFNIIRKKIRFKSPFVISIVVLAALVLISTFLNAQSPRNWLGQWAPRVVVVLLTAIASKGSIKELISASIILSTTLCTINLATVIAFPDGLYQTSSTFIGDNFFLGHRNGTSGIIIQMIFCSLLLDNIEEGYFAISWRTRIVYLVGLIQSVCAFSATIVITLVIVFLGCILLQSKAFAKVINPIEASIVGIVGNIGIVMLRIHVVLAPLINAVLHRDATLSSRTIIWDKTVQLLHWPNSLLGRGINGHEQIVINETTIASAHNELLNIALQAGVLGLIAYLTAIGSILWATFKVNGLSVFRLSSLLLTVIFILGITYVTSCVPIYLTLAIFYYSIENCSK